MREASCLYRLIREMCAASRLEAFLFAVQAFYRIEKGFLARLASPSQYPRSSSSRLTSLDIGDEDE